MKDWEQGGVMALWLRYQAGNNLIATSKEVSVYTKVYYYLCSPRDNMKTVYDMQKCILKQDFNK